jgi:nitronate monooxygenase
MALINAQKGNMKHGFAFAGANAYKAKDIVSVKELIKSLIVEYEESAPI